jgi:hypothetical protein
MFLPIKLPSGVHGNGTEYESKGRYYQANLVRWQDDVLLPVGGWTKVNRDAPFTGLCRGLYAWRDNSRRRYLAIGTHLGLYVWSDTGFLADITPTTYPPGREHEIYGAGYGFSNYGLGVYGKPLPSPHLTLDATTWSLDSWGEYLVGCASHDGEIYEWTLDPAIKAAAIAAAPVDNAGLFVSAERHLVAIGAGANPRRVAWSDRENNAVWTPASSNLAGDFEIQTHGALRCAVKLRGETLLLTSEDAHTMRHVGSPFVYGFDRLGTGCGVASNNAAVSVGDTAVWMSYGGWFIYDGVLRPLASDVHDYVMKDINREQLSKIAAGVNADFTEVWWFYPSAGSAEIDRYVAWNYKDNHWTVGELSRTALASRDVFSNPIMAGSDGFLYRHEDGWTADGAPLVGQRFVQSGTIELGSGDRLLVATRLIPDERTEGQTTVRFEVRDFPHSSPVEQGPFTMSEQVMMRWTARQIALRIEGAADAPWRVGTPRLDVVQGSRR